MSKTKIMSFKADELFEVNLMKIIERTGKTKAAVLRRCVVIGAKQWWSEIMRDGIPPIKQGDTISSNSSNVGGSDAPSPSDFQPPGEG
jgi:hypothetical protein